MRKSGAGLERMSVNYIRYFLECNGVGYFWKHHFVGAVCLRMMLLSCSLSFWSQNYAEDMHQFC